MILNTDPGRKAKVLVRLFDQSTGAKVAQTKVKIPAHSVSTLLLSSDAFANAGANYQGMAVIWAKGANPPALVVAANNPFRDPKLKGTTGYNCSPV
jgi:hypothetical protein